MRSPRALAWLRVSQTGLAKGKDEISDFGQIALQPVTIDRSFPETGTQRVMMGAEPLDLRIEIVEMRQIADADRAATDLVLIGGGQCRAGWCRS